MQDDLIQKVADLMNEQLEAYARLESVTAQLSAVLTRGEPSGIESLTRAGESELLRMRSRLLEITSALTNFAEFRAVQTEKTPLATEIREQFEAAAKKLLEAARSFQKISSSRFESCHRRLVVCNRVYSNVRRSANHLSCSGFEIRRGGACTMSINFSAFEIGRRALNANQVGINVTGQNISNVNTPGYTRQSVQLAESTPTQVNGYTTRNRRDRRRSSGLPRPFYRIETANRNRNFRTAFRQTRRARPGRSGAARQRKRRLAKFDQQFFRLVPRSRSQSRLRFRFAPSSLKKARIWLLHFNRRATVWTTSGAAPTSRFARRLTR